MGLNEPQLQIAEDSAAQLSQGRAPTSVLPKEMVNEATSLATFETIVDDQGHVLASSGKIGDVVPLPPTSAFADAQKRESDWFTWEHDNFNVRDAAVIIPYQSVSKKGYVLVARSMRQTEDTIGHITLLAGLTLLGVLLAPALIILLV